ncbi:MAG: RpiB/LacA/LacB family sugar-phosphate isomerase [Candidatus Kaiserbacteria bacterium]|nr:RpiB/LacA/LacB family sugar-phosphate isomerase [Candidatus Kaiserbacteria bacterium]
MQIYFASDHAGFELKNALVDYARSLGHTAEDCGAEKFDADDDYPELIARAARKLSSDEKAGRESRAVVIGASGQGEAIVANRFKGVRCALYYGPAGRSQTDMGGKKFDILASTREHNNANALSLGARFITVPEAKEVLKKWLEISFSGGERHARRVRQIDEV